MLRRAFLALSLFTAVTAYAAETGLDRYVKKPDPTYAYNVVNKVGGEGYTFYAIDLTSQTWRTPAEVARTVWKHWLTVIKPDKVERTTGYLFITGGKTTDAAPARANPAYVEMATLTHSVIAELQDIPNEPLT